MGDKQIFSAMMEITGVTKRKDGSEWFSEIPLLGWLIGALVAVLLEHFRGDFGRYPKASQNTGPFWCCDHAQKAVADPERLYSFSDIRVPIASSPD